MARGEITIDEERCKGCSFCTHFCARGCLTIPGDRFSPSGYLLPVFSGPEKCNACSICGWMCPHYAIEVYRYVEA